DCDTGHAHVAQERAISDDLQARGHQNDPDREHAPAAGSAPADLEHRHPHRSAPPSGYHRHGLGTAHSHDLAFDSERRPSLAILPGLGVAGGLLPDPGALAILLAALANGNVMLGLFTVLLFSVGFAAVLVIVGLVAAQVGHLVLAWLD